MAYVLGGATTDDINIGLLSVGVGNDTPVPFWCGWWKPTTLTAGRGYCSFGNDFGVEVDATTSELLLRSNNATTDGQWTTSGAGIVVDTWYFLAFLFTCTNTGPTGAWRVWIGTIDTPPRELSVSNTVAPVGNFTGGSQTFYIGNKGTQSLAFQGLVDWMFISAVRVTTVDQTTHLMNLSALGSITNGAAEFVLKRYVIPAWRGDLVLMRAQVPRLLFGTTPNDAVFWSATDRFAFAVATSDGAGFTSESYYAQINGATLSQERGPMPASLVRHLAQGCDSLPRAA